uniref:Uncharacterized protein n=1 Tax=Knipowitschia caucasica TaxID=637954 RepID=A0AAV2L186_KNICA
MGLAAGRGGGGGRETAARYPGRGGGGGRGGGWGGWRGLFLPLAPSAHPRPAQLLYPSVEPLSGVSSVEGGEREE